jgi:RNA polymerase sigma-70 factor (ECF subfamily)
MHGDNFSDEELVGLRPALMVFARSFVRSPSDAEDLVQETIMRALTYRYQFSAGTRLKSWLFTIMRNTFYNDRVRALREHPGQDGCVSDIRAVNAAQEHAQGLREVSDRIERLPPAFRESLLLIAMGESCEYVASKSGCAVGTVKSRVSRARRLISEDVPRWI